MQIGRRSPGVSVSGDLRQLHETENFFQSVQLIGEEIFRDLFHPNFFAHYVSGAGTVSSTLAVPHFQGPGRCRQVGYLALVKHALFEQITSCHDVTCFPSMKMGYFYKGAAIAPPGNGPGN
ncbi:MAG: hypothetical protein NDI77_08675 [Geobacteraceae bacterium]|nr:hypothetical protein [Geobacteraceae bacterium]